MRINQHTQRFSVGAIKEPTDAAEDEEENSLVPEDPVIDGKKRKGGKAPLPTAKSIREIKKTNNLVEQIVSNFQESMFASTSQYTRLASPSAQRTKSELFCLQI